jgi:hypothetical protein
MKKESITRKSVERAAIATFKEDQKPSKPRGDASIPKQRSFTVHSS